MSLFDGLDVTSIDAELLAAIEKAHAAALQSEKLTFKEKMNGLDAKNKDYEKRLQAYGDLDPGEVPVLKEARKKTSELEAAYQARYAEKDKEIAERDRLLREKEDQFKKLDTRNKLLHSLQEYKAAKAGLPVADGADVDVIEMLERRMAQSAEGQTYFVTGDGKPFVTDTGYGGATDYISKVLQKEKAFFFQQPTGSGATGSSASGKSDTIKRSEYDRLPIAQQAAVAMKQKIVDG